MSQLMLEELARDESRIYIENRRSRRLTWPEIMALIIAAWGVGFALGLVV